MHTTRGRSRGELVADQKLADLVNYRTIAISERYAYSARDSYETFFAVEGYFLPSSAATTGALMPWPPEHSTAWPSRNELPRTRRTRSKSRESMVERQPCTEHCQRRQLGRPGPSLWANTDGAPLTNGTTIKYTLAANPGGTSPLSDWSPNTLDRFFTRAATLFQ